MHKLLQAVLFIGAGLSSFVGRAQGLHYSQFYNAPLMVSPANTGLMPTSDIRAGVNYRNQWSSLPAPFHTFSAFGDGRILQNYEHTSWLGVGGAIFNDRAGDGNLSLFSGQISSAYHLAMGQSSMLSVGLGIGLVQRSVNFSKLTFDTQWDGFTFDPQSANGEAYAFQKTTYMDISAGINYAYFPNENVYMKLGVGLLHVNTPKESFYNMENKLGMRPTANLDMLFKAGDDFITDISAYYSYQKGASELVYGASVSYNVMPKENTPNIIILGLYHRLGDAIIPTVGFEWSRTRLTTSFDISVSGMTLNNGGNGALEFSIIYQGVFSNGSRGRSSYNCPRF